MQQIRTLLPAMTLEQAKQKCPQAFATEPSNDVSSRYIFVSTENIISDMENLGWYVVSAMQRKARKGVETRFTPHMIIFQNPDIQITSEDEKLAPSIILLICSNNSYWVSILFRSSKPTDLFCSRSSLMLFLKVTMILSNKL